MSPEIFILGEKKFKDVLTDSTKKETVLKKAVATKKKFYNKSRESRNRNRSRSRSASPKRYDKNRSGSSRSYNNNRKRKSGGRDSGDSKAKRHY